MINKQFLCTLNGEKNYLNFFVTNFSSPILRADFLYFFKKVSDLDHRRLRDLNTKFETICHIKCAAIHSVKTINTNNVYHKLLEKFPCITKLPDPNTPVKHNILNFITTKGPPVLRWKLRRFTLERFKIAKIVLKTSSKIWCNWDI